MIGNAMDVHPDTLRYLSELPIGGDGQSLQEAGKRASKTWLPMGKRSAVSRESRDAAKEMRARQADIEDAIEAAGGERGHMNGETATDVA